MRRELTGLMIYGPVCGQRLNLASENWKTLADYNPSLSRRKFTLLGDLRGK